MKDKIVMESILLLLKGTCEVFVHGTQEASHDSVHNVLKDCLDDILKMQYEVYQKMTEYGWYQIQNIDTKEIQKTFTNLQNKEA